MTNASNEVLSAALGLPESDRIEIAHRLIASVPRPSTLSTDAPTFNEEFKQRLEYRDEDLIDHDEAMRRIRSALANVTPQGDSK